MSKVIVYNKECPACMKFIKRLQKKNPSFECIPKQAPDLFLRFPDLKEHSGLRLIQEGKIYSGADALVQISKSTSGYFLLSLAYRIPGMPFVLKKIGNLFST